MSVLCVLVLALDKATRDIGDSAVTAQGYLWGESGTIQGAGDFFSDNWEKVQFFLFALALLGSLVSMVLGRWSAFLCLVYGSLCVLDLRRGIAADGAAYRSCETAAGESFRDFGIALVFVACVICVIDAARRIRERSTR